VKAAQGHAWIYRGPKGELVMRSSWELAVAHEFDKRGMEWQFEPEGFTAGETMYWPDFFLPESGSYIEVKGREREKAMKKVNEFGSEYKIEVWRQKEVERFTGLKAHQIIERYNHCRLEKPKQRSLQSKRVSLVLNGESLEFVSRRAAADHFGISYGAVNSRLQIGWDVVKALTMPLDGTRYRLSDNDVALIRKFFSRNPGFGAGEFLARWFGVSCTCISEVKLGKTRKTRAT
jgi:hypothetical protein